MAVEQLRTFLRRLRYLPKEGSTSDRQLLERFASRRDEAAFEVLVWRHGGLVLGVCARVLRHAEDAEDAFQATFLMLARKADCITSGEALPGWLYKVAYRVALRLRAREGRRATVPLGPNLAEREADSETGADIRPVLDQEIHDLPEKYRAAVVLCYLEGKTTAEAARQLGCARGTVCSRLSWARRRLRSRLLRRGLTLSAALLPAVPTGPVVAATVKAAAAFMSRQPVAALLGRAPGLAEGALRAMLFTKVKSFAAVLLVLGGLGLVVGLGVQRGLAQRPQPDPAPALVRGQGDRVHLPAALLTKLGIQTVEVKTRLAARTRVLRFPGVLTLDPARLTRVRCRFAPAEVLGIGKAGGKANRELRPGDKVRKGQLLAVLYSVDAGNKKNDLFDALLQLDLDKKILDRAEKNKEFVPELLLLNYRRNVQADLSAVNRAVNTLRAWGIPEEDIAAVRREAREAFEDYEKRNHKESKPEDLKRQTKARMERWARVTLKAPESGTIVERNVSRGEHIADSPTTLFQIARLGRLLVLAKVPEDDLPELTQLTKLPPAQRRWTIEAAGAAPVEGTIDEIGYLIDPSQHTGTIKGHIDNPGRRFRAGQAVTVSVELPVAQGEVVLPASAVIEEGRRSYVFVQPDAGKFVYEVRQVSVVRRGKDIIHVRSRLTREQQRQGFQVIKPGERVVTSGAVGLMGILSDLKAREER